MIYTHQFNFIIDQKTKNYEKNFVDQTKGLKLVDKCPRYKAL